MRLALVLFPALASFLVAALLALQVGCDPLIEGEEVTCTHTFTCDGTVVADNSQALAQGRGVFCTNPFDLERDEQISAYEAEFADGCDGVFLACNGNPDDRAVCTASCDVTAACDLGDAVDVRL